MKHTQYSLFQVGLHWSMAMLFAANYIFSEGMEYYFHSRLDREAAESDWSVTLHIYVGITFVLLAVVRLAIRSDNIKPAMVTSSESILIRLAGHIHNVLYLLMFLVPVAGMSALYGKIEIIGEIHVLLVNLMLAVILLHIFSGLYHQFILKDDLLTRMSMLKR